MDRIFNNESVEKYFKENKKVFEQELLNEAVTVRDKIDDILEIGNIDLINNAHHLVSCIMEGREEELLAFAKQEGIAWATHSLTLSFKLEWVQAIRRTIWSFINKYTEAEQCKYDFFSLEKQINNRVDTFLNAFFINYSTYKDSLLKAQRDLVENLSVPIIPITQHISILPLIGTIDYFRAKVMEEKVLMEISRLRIQTLFMDLSGIANMEVEVIDQLMKIIDGASMMGCRTVITGLRPDVVRNIIRLGVRFDEQTETIGSLQQALRTYLL